MKTTSFDHIVLVCSEYSQERSTAVNNKNMTLSVSFKLDLCYYCRDYTHLVFNFVANTFSVYGSNKRFDTSLRS
jgi:hypothetical protein